MKYCWDSRGCPEYEVSGRCLGRALVVRPGHGWAAAGYDRPDPVAG